MTDYHADVERVRGEIAALRAGEAACQATPEERRRLLYRRFQEASLTGELHRLGALDEDVAAAIGSMSQASASDLCLLRAYLAVKRHRLADAESIVASDAALAGSSQGWLVLADVDVQQSRFTDARVRIERALAEDRTWDGLARLAHLAGVLGDLDEADRLYLEAEDELTAKQMQTYAWLEVQRGFMKFQRGLQADAMRHYERAGMAYSGYWLVEERVAELIGAQGDFPRAIAAYTGLYDASPRPEWEQAIGDLYALCGEHETAHAWKRKAHSHYLESVSRGEVFYYHFLVDVCCELAGHEGDAVMWATKDVGIRSDFSTQGDLAWALYRNGQVDDAVQWIEEALASGAVSARLYLQAACIYSEAAMIELGSHYARRALAANPAPARARLAARPLRVVSRAAPVVRSAALTASPHVSCVDACT